MTRLSFTESSVSSVSCCGTTPRRPRIRGPSAFGSRSRMRSVPALTGDTHATMRMVEVLPAPFGPRNPKLSPGATSKSIASTAVNSPNRFVKPRAWMSGGVSVGLGMGGASYPTARVRGCQESAAAMTGAAGRSPAWTMLSNSRQSSVTRIALPTNPNQKGAVMPYSRASQPPIGVPATLPAMPPTWYTPVTRPRSSSDLARWRTAVDVVPHTKACIPNTTNVTRATAGSVVSASTRWVPVSMSRPTRMMSASENRRSSRPYDTVPMIPPIAIAVVSSPNPTSLMCSRSWAYRTRTDHAAPNVTLNATIVMNRVRIGGCAASHRMPSAMSARHEPRGAVWSPGSAAVEYRTRVISTAPSAKQAASVANGNAIPAANRNAPIGGATSWFVSRTLPWRRAFAIPRSSRRTSRGRMLPPPTSANVSAVPRTNNASRTTAMLTAPVTIVAARTARIAARHTLTRAIIRTRSTRSATTPAVKPNSSTGTFCASNAIETRSGSRVCDATSSGPAASATPSPTLVRTEVARSHRNERPRRAGTVASARRATGSGIAAVYACSRRGGHSSARESVARNRPLVERDDPAGHAAPAHVDEAGLGHDLRDPLRGRVGLDRFHEVRVRRALACQPADDGDDPVEPPAHEPGEARRGPSDLEAQDSAAGSHRARHLLEPAPVVRQVPHPECDRRGVERPVLGRQRERVADHEPEAVPAAVPDPRHVDHPGAQVDAQDAAERRHAPVEVGRHLAGAARDVERGVTRPQPGAFDEAAAPARLLERRDDEVHQVVPARDPVEHHPDLGRCGRIACARARARGCVVGRKDLGHRAGSRASGCRSVGGVAGLVFGAASAARMTSATAPGSVIGVVWVRPSSRIRAAPGMRRASS